MEEALSRVATGHGIIRAVEQYSEQSVDEVVCRNRAADRGGAGGDMVQ